MIVTLDTTMPAGRYECTLIVPPPQPPPSDYTLLVDRTVAGVNQPIQCLYSSANPMLAKDWIGLFKVGAAREIANAYEYVDKLVGGTFTASAPEPGTYEFRLCANDGYDVHARSSAIVVTGAVITPPPGPPTGRPDATNTGPTDRTKLRTITGTYLITTSGTYSDFEALGGISISASNVILRNFVSRDNIKIYSGSGTVMEDGEVYSTTGSDGISGSEMTLRRLNIHDVHDAIRIGSSGNTLVERCYIHDIGTESGHSDGIQVLSDVPNVRILENHFVVHNCTSCVNGVGGGWLLQKNWFYGGGYTLYCYQSGTPRVIENGFGDIHSGVARFWPSTGIWENNINLDTGAPI